MSEINQAKAYYVSVKEVDDSLEKDPTSLVDHVLSGRTKPHFRESHPALYMPKHNYRKYKMKGRQEESGLNIIREKPKLKESFAIMNLVQGRKQSHNPMLRFNMSFDSMNSLEHVNTKSVAAES